MEKDQLTHIALVLEVEKHECLYNTTLPDYARKDITEEAWIKISDNLKMPGQNIRATALDNIKTIRYFYITSKFEILSCISFFKNTLHFVLQHRSKILIKAFVTVAECKEKWRNIRSTFRRSFKPARNGKSKRSYYLSRYLNFILPYSKPMEDSIFRVTDNENNDFMVVLKDVDVNSENSIDESVELPTSSQPQSSWEDIPEPQDYEVEADMKFNPRTETQTTLGQQPISSEEDFSIPEHLKRIDDSDTAVDQNEREHMKYFFLSLLPEFRNMSEKQMRSFKIKVLQLIDDIKSERLTVKSDKRI